MGGGCGRGIGQNGLTVGFSRVAERRGNVGRDPALARRLFAHRVNAVDG